MSPEPTWSRASSRHRLGLGVAAAVVLVVIGTLWAAREQHRPPRRDLPAPVLPAVVLVPIGPFDADRLRDLPRDYRAEYGLTLTIAASINPPPAAFDPVRRQFAAEDLVAAVADQPGAATAGTVAIGVTSADIFIRNVDWRWAFALREDGHLAVISVARMPDTRYVNRWYLFRKMLTREIGFLSYGLPPSGDPYDLLYQHILGVSDLRRVFDHL